MRIFLFSLVLLSSFSVFAAESTEKDRLAVMDVQDKNMLFSQETIGNITDYIFGKFAGTRLYWMIPKSDRDSALEQAIEETVKGSRKECVDEKCQLSLVAQLQANFLINTKMKKLYQGTCNIGISKFDVEKRAGVDSWEEKFNCTEKGLYETIDGFNLGGGSSLGNPLKNDRVADENACKFAKKNNTLVAWETYLDKYTDGVCAFEATVRVEELKPKTKNDTAKQVEVIKTSPNWSKKAPQNTIWNDAKEYCENLNEDGYSDWRLPTISELRALIKNCTATENGGACKVTNDCLKLKCRNDACGGCSDSSDGRYSKLGDTGWLWSSSEQSDDKSNAWSVGFNGGGVYFSNFKLNNFHVRCVR